MHCVTNSDLSLCVWQSEGAYEVCLSVCSFSTHHKNVTSYGFCGPLREFMCELCGLVFVDWVPLFDNTHTPLLLSS